MAAQRAPRVRDRFPAWLKGRMSLATCAMTMALTGLWLTGIAALSPAMGAEPKPWQLGLPEPVSPLARQMSDFHNYWLLPLIIAISVLVLLLLIYVCIRFRAGANPTPSRTTHNSVLEVLWTGVPVLILVVLAFPSLKLLYDVGEVQDADMTLKITGHQWYWEYQYPDYDDLTFDALLVARTQEEADAEGVLRLMDTDNLVVLPVNTKIRLQFTSADVLHNWSLSDLGVRVDTVPGRLSEAWTLIEKPGMYYGFCSELCGTDHAYMPIAVKAVTKAEFARWVEGAKVEFAQDGPTPNRPTGNMLAAHRPTHGHVGDFGNVGDQESAGE